MQRRAATCWWRITLRSNSFEGFGPCVEVGPPEAPPAPPANHLPEHLLDRGVATRAVAAKAHVCDRQVSQVADFDSLDPSAFDTPSTKQAFALLADSGLALQSLHACHPRQEDLQAAHRAIGLSGVTVEQGPPNLVATLTTPNGIVTLESAGT